MKENLLNRILPHLRTSAKNGFMAWVFVAKLSIPAMLLTRLLIWFDLIPYVAMVFKPVMNLLGLPPEAALVWVSAMLANVYAGVTVYLSLMPVMEPLSVSQVTVLTCMCLLAHALLIEGQICRATGLSFWRITAFRIISAMIFGTIVHLSATLTGWGAEPSSLMVGLELPAEAVPSWLDWFINSVKQLLIILVVVEVLMLLMEAVKHSGLTRLIMKVLGPPLRLAGVGENAVMVTVIGCVLGLAYGGGLIVAESRSGHISNRDIYAAITLMAVFHSMVEDTIVMWALGGSIWWLLGARLIFALAVAAVVNRLAVTKRWKPILVGNQLEFETTEKPDPAGHGA
ncbi:hypothetical protein C4J81_10730 [Deltaproteobacteria bacterium Smac51]|nr:hypothetical protein C4J81_10730 [Deltaproteobacteria bacterium Smac51]